MNISTSHIVSPNDSPTRSLRRPKRISAPGSGSFAEEELLGHARGRIFEIEHELKEFVEDACALYIAHRMTVQQNQNVFARLTK